jgi:lipoprotein-releasing system permease protein
MLKMNQPRVRSLLFLGLRFLLGKRSGNIKGRKIGETRHGTFWGAVFGVSISIIPLYIVIFVSNGMIQGITDRYLETKTAHLQAALPFFIGDATREALSRYALEQQGVLSTSFEIDGLGLAASKYGSASAQIRGLEKSIVQDAGFRRFMHVDDGLLFPNAQNEAVMGKYLAKALQLKVGDTVTLITLRDGNSEILLPKMSIFQVAGIVSTGYRELDANWFIIQSTAAERILNAETAYAFLGIKVSDPYHVTLDLIASNIDKKMQQLGLSTEGISSVRTWHSIEQGLFKSFSSTKSILIFIMALAVIIAAINLSSALTTYVMEHRQETAILKSFGSSRGQTAAVFLLGGIIIGSIGCLIGSVVGVFISININQILNGVQSAINFLSGALSLGANPVRILNPDYYLEYIPISFDWSYVFIIMIASICASALVSLVPAIKSASIAPAELIRHD